MLNSTVVETARVAPTMEATMRTRMLLPLLLALLLWLGGMAQADVASSFPPSTSKATAFGEIVWGTGNIVQGRAFAIREGEQDEDVGGWQCDLLH